MAKPFYITTTLPYVNAPLHIGHALEFIRADALARYHMQVGYDVFFNTGTDEHGQKIATKASDQGISPQAFVDKGFATFKAQVASFGVTDAVHYIRTTDEHHIAAAQAFWTRVHDNGYIYKKNYEAKYCVGCEAEKTDSELVDGECPLHPGIALETINEENYFFKFSAFGERLLAYYEANPHFVVPSFRFNEMKAFVAAGLEDFSISRLTEKMSWGVPVPGDDTQVMYVWFDALTNYISTLGWPEDESLFEKYWKEGTPTQYCGKDNTRFQSVMWQAMLMAADLPQSAQVIVNGFITGEGGVRMSKTLGNVVDPLAIAEEYGTDALRFFLLKEVSSFEDSPFTIERFRESFQANLANGIGNLTSRIMTLAETHLETPVSYGEIVDEEVQGFVLVRDLQKAMDAIWRRIKALDVRMTDEAPFKLVKTDPEAGKRVIGEMVAELAAIGTLLAPFMPTTSAHILAVVKANMKPEAPLFARLA